MQDRFVFVEMPDEFGDPPQIAELVLLIRALVRNGNDDTFVEEREFPESLRQRIKIELTGFKNGGVRFKSNLSPTPVSVTGFLQGL